MLGDSQPQVIQIQIKTAVVLAFPSRWGEPASGPRQRGCWGLSADRLSGRISKADLQQPSSGFEDVNLSKVPHLEQDHVQIVGRPDNGVSSNRCHSPSAMRLRIRVTNGIHVIIEVLRGMVRRQDDFYRRATILVKLRVALSGCSVANVVPDAAGTAIRDGVTPALR
jgi:hypothetical protein